jgi:hypothetical protein
MNMPVVLSASVSRHGKYTRTNEYLVDVLTDVISRPFIRKHDFCLQRSIAGVYRLCVGHRVRLKGSYQNKNWTCASPLWALFHSFHSTHWHWDAPMPTLPLLLLSLSVILISCLADSFHSKRALATTQQHQQPHEFQYSPGEGSASASGVGEDLQLMDIVLLASVDGKFHALNRTSGQTLWSMSSSAFLSSSVPSTLGPLVRTHHVDTDDGEEHQEQELYIIEPQSGYIYVMSSPNSPLQRLSFSMSELVNMSPFSFSVDALNTEGNGAEAGGDGKGDRRIFVGRKDLRHDREGEAIDLDELENMETPPPGRVTEVSIGRTGESLLPSPVFPH